MDFELSDEQAMLRAASRDLLSDHSPVDVVRAQMERAANDAEDVDPVLWRLAGELGWPGLAVVEEHGGTGQGLIELALVAEEVGRAAARVPLLPTALVGRAVARGGPAQLQAEVLPALAAGSAWASWAVAEPRSPWALDGVHATARVDGDATVLHGVKTLVQDAGGARWLLVTALRDGAPESFLVDREAPGVSVRRQQVLDLTRAFYEVRLDGVRVPRERHLSGGATDVQRLLDDASVLRSAEALGVMDRMLELTVEYMKVRVQFGRPLGTFQAVKQKCATMAMLVHGTRAATYYAAMATDAGTTDAARAACVAASYSGAATGDVAGDSLQLHGGIGFTWEHDLHLYLRRAKVDGVLYGDAAVHRDRLCGLVSAGARHARQTPASV
ncbi:acyl-CoA dehydrogenase family protein [Pseudonocardia kunmingensis]|uniref:Alkylation response protein AidB-like acyl-CoA dehydrogenase n=1 Tax=Pseudonocardia kunmingensis TaxID=630975 RepID=A0A543DPW5_9PSEU|nr:acyl-CoA dehydrogenase family protein [Pseudonocardia kunmingensis]TQM11376.1 alkylation response protein AidB-like acyl-CoA dehydrogenase [Pseudonocardia kunmingensis]